MASSEARNSERSVSGDTLTRKSCGKKVDMLIKHITSEYACAEAGKYQSSDSTKELIESNLICPKTMRDMVCKLATSNPSQLHQIATVGFIFMGMLHLIDTSLFFTLDFRFENDLPGDDLPEWQRLPFAASWSAFIPRSRGKLCRAHEAVDQNCLEDEGYLESESRNRQPR